MKKDEKSKSMCAGCYDDFYNHGGATGLTNNCWSYDSAEIVKGFEIGLMQNPPYVKCPIIKKLSCFRFSNKYRRFIKLPEDEQKTRKKTWTMQHW
jgi:hypothetical protein